MNRSLEDDILRLQAANLIQSAEMSALLFLFAGMRRALEKSYPDLPSLDADFLSARKKMLHLQLESLEKTQPEFAAKLQELIDKSSTIFPFDYD